SGPRLYYRHTGIDRLESGPPAKINIVFPFSGNYIKFGKLYLRRENYIVIVHLFGTVHLRVHRAIMPLP
ncbi:MAG TPA: hypothetical protein VKQ30_10305, partial [Ktedonobacterales bacterium]|nr:hypothetical protein [Ktedonobacterales bacterium]